MLKKYIFLCVGFGILGFATSCSEGSLLDDLLPSRLKIYEFDLPAHFPDPTLYIDSENIPTVAKVELGRRLFFDPILSSDGTISCASCHLPDQSFADPRPLSIGVNGKVGKRNAPALVNVMYGQSFFWHGSTPSLERQVLFPIEDSTEMNSSFPEVLAKINQHPEYPSLFREAFGTEPNPDALTDAIASFERSLVSSNAPYDRYLEGDTTALNQSQLRGMTLFFGEKAECFHCHAGFNFTDESFKNNGLYEAYQDPGRWEVTGSRSDLGKFKVPTLRNIEFTAPYMHDGSIGSLEEVMDHYASGGKNHPNKSVLIRRFILSEQEKEDLINFLKALSDPSFLKNPAFQNPL